VVATGELAAGRRAVLAHIIGHTLCVTARKLFGRQQHLVRNQVSY
jgi:hypothetical protein